MAPAPATWVSDTRTGKGTDGRARAHGHFRRHHLTKQVGVARRHPARAGANVQGGRANRPLLGGRLDPGPEQRLPLRGGEQEELGLLEQRPGDPLVAEQLDDAVREADPGRHGAIVPGGDPVPRLLVQLQRLREGSGRAQVAEGVAELDHRPVGARRGQRVARGPVALLRPAQEGGGGRQGRLLHAGERGVVVVEQHDDRDEYGDEAHADLPRQAQDGHGNRNGPSWPVSPPEHPQHDRPTTATAAAGSDRPRQKMGTRGSRLQ